MRNAPNPYAFDEERLHWFQRFTLEPTAPREITERLRDGERLQTTDVPGYLGQKAHTSCETGEALYRLVQLWGTPNVPGMTAGAMELERERTTWQFLFDVDYEPRPDEDEAVPETFRLSVYDYKTDVSAGLSGFAATSSDGRPVEEPTESVVESVTMPPDSFLEGVVSLALNMVDEAVPSTYRERWV